MNRRILALAIGIVMLLSMIPAFAEEAPAATPVGGVTAETHVEDLGWFVDSFTVELAEGFDATGIDKDNLVIENNKVHPSFAMVLRRH